MNTLTSSPPAIVTGFLDEASGLQLVMPRIPFAHAEVQGNQFIYALCTPTVVNSSFNPFAGTQINAGATVVINKGSDDVMTRAFYYSLTARIKESPSADLLENSIILYAGSNPIARIQVEATTQKTGQAVYIGDGTNGDGMFYLENSSTTVSGGAIEETNNIYTKVAHGLETGDIVELDSLTGGTGVNAGQIYFFHKLSADTGYLCTTAANARAGTAINVTLDATSVVLIRAFDVVLALSLVDPNLVIDLRVLGSNT